MNNDLRREIVKMITAAGEGHIPSAFSIVDIIATLYGKFLTRSDYFVLSKGHGCAALYAVLATHGVLTDADLKSYGTYRGILGGHPDRTKAPGVHASTGSLGHGFPSAAGIALGLRIQNKDGRVVCLVGDGECHEGTVWETALIGHRRGLNNLCVIVDDNLSAAQIMPHPNLAGQWDAFGWEVHVVRGHNDEIEYPLDRFFKKMNGLPMCIIAQTVKGKGVPMLEGHGAWHHKIPNQQELEQIMLALA